VNDNRRGRHELSHGLRLSDPNLPDKQCGALQKDLRLPTRARPNRRAATTEVPLAKMARPLFEGNEGLALLHYICRRADKPLQIVEL
jgi:hypothetical protein